MNLPLRHVQKNTELQQAPIAFRAAEEVGDVKHLVSHNDPAILVGVVLGNFFSADRHSFELTLTRGRRHD